MRATNDAQANERSTFIRHPAHAWRRHAVSARAGNRAGQPRAHRAGSKGTSRANRQGESTGAAEAQSTKEVEAMKKGQLTNADRGIEAVRALPDSIRVAGYDFQIVKWTTHEASACSRWGEFSQIEQVIRIQENIPSPFKAVDTFLHEVSHAIFWAYGIHDDDKEERIVSTMGTALMTVHRDNPWLAPWLTKALK